MQFVELALQGVRNFTQLYRIPFGRGVTVLVGGAGSGKSTIVEVLLRLLDPEPLEQESQDLRGPAGDACRAALLMASERGEVFRILRDFSAGSMQLARRDASGQFQNISSSRSEIRQYLGGELHLPQRDLLEGLFVLRGSSLPSCQPRTAPAISAPPQPIQPSEAAAPPLAAGGEKKPPVFRGYQGAELQDEQLPQDAEEIRRQIETLRRDLELAREVDDLQFELDGLRRQLFEFEQKTRAVAEAERKAEELERQSSALGGLEKLPSDFERRVREFISLRQRKERDLERLEEEKQQWEKRLHQQAPLPLKQNRFFMGGVALGIAALLAGTAGFFLDESLRWLALFDLVGFGVALFAALRHIDEREASSRAASRLQAIEQRKKKVEQEFEIGTTVVRKTMSELAVDSPEAILEQYASAAQLKSQAEEARREVERLRADPALLEAAAKEKELKEKVNQLEGRLAGATGLMMSPQEMERRLRLLEEKLQSPDQPPSSLPAQEDQPAADYGADGYGEESYLPAGPPGALKAAAAAGLPPSPLLAAEAALPAAPLGPLGVLMRCADDVMLMERERSEALLAPRAGQILAALSEGSMNRLTFAPGGQVECGGHGGGQPFEALPPASQDLVYLALRIAILEQASQRQKTPIVFDESFERMPARLQALLGRALAYLGKLTQVIYLSRDESWAQFGTNSLRLG